MGRNVNLLIILLMVFTVAVVGSGSPANAADAVNSTDYLYAADYNHDMVHVYNVTSSSFAKVAAIPVEKPSAIVASHDGKRVYVASSGLLTSGLYVISTDKNLVLANYSLPDNGAGAISISPDDRHVYVVTPTRFIILDTATGKLTQKTLSTDQYTTLTAAADAGNSFAFFTAPGSSNLFVYSENDGSITTYHLNCEIGHITALDGTRLLGTDKLGEINILKYNYYTGVEGWSYTPRPIGGSSSFFEPYIAVSNDQKLAYFIDRENNKVYKVNLEDYTATLLSNASEWRSPTRAVFSSDDSKVFICDDTGVIGLYTANDSQYMYFYGYKAMDVDIASVPVTQTSEPGPATPTASPVSPSPKATLAATYLSSPTATPATVPPTTPTMAVLPLIALILAIYSISWITGRK